MNTTTTATTMLKRPKQEVKKEFRNDAVRICLQTELSMKQMRNQLFELLDDKDFWAKLELTKELSKQARQAKDELFIKENPNY